MFARGGLRRHFRADYRALVTRRKLGTAVALDAEAGRAIAQSFARYRPVDAVDAAVEEEQEPESSETPVYDIETPEGLQTLERILNGSSRPTRSRRSVRVAMAAPPLACCGEALAA